MRTGAPLEKARIAPAAPTPAPMSAEPEITAWMVSPAPCVPTFSSTRPCFLKMPASWPSVGAWFSQLLIWPIASLSVSSARAGVHAERQRHDEPERGGHRLEGLHAISSLCLIFYRSHRRGRHSTPIAARAAKPISRCGASSPRRRLAARGRLLGRGGTAPPLWPPASPSIPTSATSPVVLLLIVPASLRFARRQRGDGAADGHARCT